MSPAFQSEMRVGIDLEPKFYRDVVSIKFTILTCRTYF
jgi:hypothetical protein